MLSVNRISPLSEPSALRRRTSMRAGTRCSKRPSSRTPLVRGPVPKTSIPHVRSCCSGTTTSPQVQVMELRQNLYMAQGNGESSLLLILRVGEIWDTLPDVANGLRDESGRAAAGTGVRATRVAGGSGRAAGSLVAVANGTTQLGQESPVHLLELVLFPGMLGGQSDNFVVRGGASDEVTPRKDVATTQ